MSPPLKETTTNGLQWDNWNMRTLVQINSSREQLRWPELPYSKLACNSSRQVPLNSVEVDERALHPIDVGVVPTKGAQPKRKCRLSPISIWLPRHLQHVQRRC
jgi:hypothetical protein